MQSLKMILGNYYTPVSRIIHENWALLFPKSYVKFWYKKNLQKKLNLKNPRDFNEKIQWLKIYTDTSKWTDLADKYKVREYIKQCGLEDILVKLYGVWMEAEDIDFSKLPNKFVLKTNNAFGTVILVNDKSKLDIDKTRKQLNDWLKRKYGLISFEPHYWRIKRCIIAEEFLQDNYNTELSSSLIDYKFWCIHGEPRIIVAMINRNNKTVSSKADDSVPQFQDFAYDLDWNLHPEILTSPTLNNNPQGLPKPKCLDEMIEICRVLSKPFPAVRVDLYEVNNKVYFGEVTFTPGGNLNYFSPKYFLKLGEKINLSKVDRKKRWLFL